MTDAPTFFPVLPLMDPAIAISRQSRHNFYDCLYVALAEREVCELVTGDEKLLRNLGPSFPFITSLSSLSWHASGAATAMRRRIGNCCAIARSLFAPCVLDRLTVG